MIRTLLLLLSGLSFSWTSFSQGSGVNMSLVGHLDYYALHTVGLNDCWAYVDETGIEYALVGTTNGTSVVSLADPTNPVEVFWVEGSQSIWRDLQVWGDYAYITTEANDGMLIIDLSPLPASNDLDTTTYTGGEGPDYWDSAHDVFIDAEGYAYICGADRGEGGIIILDVHTDPMNPVEVGQFDTWYCHDAFAQGNLLYGAHIADGLLSIIDITDRTNPQLINTQLTPNTFTHNVWVTSDDHYAVTTDEVAGAYLTLYDVSNPNDIRETDRIRSSPGQDIIPHNAFILADSLIVTSYYTDGVTIHDMRRPHNLVEIASYDTNPLETGTFDGAWGTYAFLPSGLILASDRGEGLFVLEAELVAPCYYEGLVRDAVTLDELAGVTITMTGDPQGDLSDASGNYAVGTVVPGTRNVTFSKTAYYPQTVAVNFATNELLTDTIDLVPIPPFNLTVIVEDAGAGNDPIIDANIRITVPEMIVEGQTNGFGEDEIQLYYPGNATITVGKWGYKTACAQYEIDETTGTVTIQLEKGIYDDFSFDFGWTTTVDGAITGLWERGIPIGSNDVATTADDAGYDCEGYAFVTGNGEGPNTDFDDLDGGRVTLYSPQFDLTAETDPYIHYHRWFHCLDGPQWPDDTLEIFLSNGIQTVLVDKALPNGQLYDQWVSRSVHVSDFLTPTADMQLIVTISDEDPRINITEAGIDFFFVANQDFVGTDAAEQTNLELFPNPVEDQLHIDGVLSEQPYRILDITGALVAEGQLKPGENQLSCEFFRPGMYLLETGETVMRFIKE